MQDHQEITNTMTVVSCTSKLFLSPSLECFFNLSDGSFRSKKKKGTFQNIILYFELTISEIKKVKEETTTTLIQVK